MFRKQNAPTRNFLFFADFRADFNEKRDPLNARLTAFVIMGSKRTGRLKTFNSLGRLQNGNHTRKVICTTIPRVWFKRLWNFSHLICICRAKMFTAFYRLIIANGGAKWTKFHMWLALKIKLNRLFVTWSSVQVHRSLSSKFTKNPIEMTKRPTKMNRKRNVKNSKVPETYVSYLPVCSTR